MRKTSYNKATGPESFILPLLRENIEDALNSLALDTTPQDVLDIGCGNQPFRELITEIGLNYYSLDHEQNELGNVDYLRDLNKSINIEKQFDVVLCTEVLEHIYNWESAFQNFSRLLSKGGKLIVTTPFVYTIHEPPVDYWRPTLFALEKYAADHNFRITSHKQLGDAWDVLGTFSHSVHLFNTNRSVKTRLLFRIAFIILKFLRD